MGLTKKNDKIVVILLTLAPLLVFVYGAHILFDISIGTSQAEYVYYAYIPPAVCNMTVVEQRAGEIVVKSYNYTSFPSNLEVVGIEDNTNYYLYDLSTKELIRSGSLNKYQRVTISLGEFRTSTEPFEVEDYYLKLVTDKPVSALLWGGSFKLEGVHYAGFAVLQTISKFVPSLEGGFIGREFVFLTVPTYWEIDRLKYEENKYLIFATEDAKVKIYDSQGNLVQELSVGRLSMARTDKLEPWSVYRVESTGNIMVYGTSMDSMTYVPSLTGGYVGRDFIATRAGSLWAGDKQSFIVVALEDARVSLYDMRKPAGSAADVTLEVKKGEMAFDTSIQVDVPLRVKSTGDITLLVGGNEWGWGATWSKDQGFVIPEYISEDVTLLGAKEGQEIGFYAPYRAVLFASGDTEVEINGIPREMRRDDFITLASGTYIVKPSSAPVIVEVIGDTNIRTFPSMSYSFKSFDDWGAYLISPDVLYKTYAPIEEGGGVDIFLYAGAGAAAAAVAVVLVVLMRRKRAK